MKKSLKRKKNSLPDTWNKTRIRSPPNPEKNDNDDKCNLIQKIWLMERQLSILQKRVEELEGMNIPQPQAGSEDPWNFYIS